MTAGETVGDPRLRLGDVEPAVMTTLTPQETRSRMARVGERVELARYHISSGERIV
jgi:hypothetical protein